MPINEFVDAPDDASPDELSNYGGAPFLDGKLSFLPGSEIGSGVAPLVASFGLGPDRGVLAEGAAGGGTGAAWSAATGAQPADQAKAPQPTQYFNDYNNAPLGPAQNKTYGQMDRDGRLDRSAPRGSNPNPFVMVDGHSATPTDGQAYIDLAGRLHPERLSDDAIAATRTVYGEARGQPAEGQQAVMGVIMNRARTMGQTWKRVASSGQFQGYAVGAGLSPGDPRFDKVYRNIRPLMNGEVSDPSKGAYFFLNPQTSDPQVWSKGPPSAVIADHNFYPDLPDDIYSRAERRRAAAQKALAKPPAR